MIYVGSLATKPDRDSQWIKEFRKLSWEVIPFCSECYGETTGIRGKINRRLHIGKKNAIMQKNLIEMIKQENPVWVHFRLPIDFSKKTILTIKKYTQIVTQYFNDDPFSKRSPSGLYWKFHKALIAYDGHFVYRSHNLVDYIKAGAKYVEHCPPAYDPERHCLGQRQNDGSFIADAAFIGHWENDVRVDFLDALHKSGFKIIIKGGMWNQGIKGKSISNLMPINHAFGKEYNFIYSNVIAGLCFFSKINNDTWTERALEIIAVGGLLVCERTIEAESNFVDREEAFFFSSIDELKDIINNLKINPSYREKVRSAGYHRLLAGNHTISHRALQIEKFVRNKM